MSKVISKDGVDQFMEGTSPAATTAADDVEVILSTEAAQKVLDAMKFPLDITVPSGLAAVLSDAGEEASIVDVRESTAADDQYPLVREIGEELGAALQRVAEEWRQLAPADRPVLSREEQQLLDALSQQLSAPSRNERALRDTVMIALRQFVSVEVLWVKLEVSRPAGFQLGDPIVLPSIDVRAQARIKACIHVFKKICVTVTTPRIHFSGRDLQLDLSNEGAKVMATPRFGDLDIVIRIKIWKFSFTIRIGVTKIVNGAIGKKPFKLVDLSALEHDVPFGSGKVRLESVECAQHPRGLLMSCETSVG